MNGARPTTARTLAPCRLLVSVRDAREARLAVEAGVDLIDIKEPRAGSLGAAVPSRVKEIVATVAGSVPISVALGELGDAVDIPELLRDVAVRYAKVGLAGCVRFRDWQCRWQQRIACLPKTVDPVAVVYADWREARAPSPTEILGAARELGCQAVLVDTHVKPFGNLFAHWSLAEVEAFVGRVHDQELTAVVAGSLSGSLIDDVLGTGVDYIAVRGAVCTENRAGTIDRGKLNGLVRQIRTATRGL